MYIANSRPMLRNIYDTLIQPCESENPTNTRCLPNVDMKDGPASTTLAQHQSKSHVCWEEHNTNVPLTQYCFNVGQPSETRSGSWLLRSDLTLLGLHDKDYDIYLA